MDKKRREKMFDDEVVTIEQEGSYLNAVSELITSYEQCGIISRKYRFLKKYGLGYFEFHDFDGLYVEVFDVLLQKDFKIKDEFSNSFLELYFLIEGEQIVKTDAANQDVVCESQESYMVYYPKVKGTTYINKRKRLKKIKIRMNNDFIKRHHIDEAYNVIERYSLKNALNNFIQPLNTKTQGILSEIMSDDRKGLLKRLFLESKILELVALQLETKQVDIVKKNLHTDNLIKKIYQTQHYIASDLSVQYSIQQLARQIGLNDFVLKKEFKRVFGQTIFEYASQLRMEKAKKLLDHSTKPIYEISELVGYKNATHFSAAFKKVEGVTPKKYRNSTKIE